MAILTDEERDIDPYDVLGVTLEMGEKEIRKAYRKLSLRCHPDKNPGPEAEAMFHSISLALAILTNPEKRKFIDGKLAQSRAQAVRRAEMDSKRKAKVDDLLRREEDAKRARKDALDARKEAAKDEAVHDAGRRMVEERRKRQEAAIAAARQEKKSSPPPAPPPISPEDLQLKLQLPVGCTQGDLETALNKYGAIEAVHVALAKGKKGPRALVEFAAGNWGGCWACMHDGAGIGAKAKWAAGEPAWVQWAAQQRENGKGTGFGFGSAPDISDMKDRQRQREKDAAMESATLLRMRQAERERMVEEIRRAEA
ncbi:hypothetical protein CcaverHIS002_0210550 [Cutaneotrichosporon cavernicola]|uniref:J domain-containing protein n=1 Tax=Cutaneotrichosporon cavernicola TaxID=279322 RepID=A0AA48L2N3_9TREE|nr:uncharacterized protein CcaverHIS019_0210550 [Cutaneotrichosporon cavernicola]BEI81895.1 hypothetical protein CcaverHIS002_0210550 [Cutaneotrichosporon cavernicola]BEI89693.1 hypothetical protein CcaverHIS019_0210550 [Cutaneotrichosporon cavernicola]BEI97464.1 hypothetical protein CcaverHIS631_0210530 [Cutaneotrichosporon cavernicola]BEJ05242.1 hypothetical protein CcaverHIS641_0210590 [Cutaneotrichosporon cavernicola]